jgi:hypothetical protein
LFERFGFPAMDFSSHGFFQPWIFPAMDFSSHGFFQGFTSGANGHMIDADQCDECILTALETARRMSL